MRDLRRMIEAAAKHITAPWIWCGLVGLMAVIGLFVAANAGAESPVGYWGGLGYFAFGVLFVLWQIKLGYDRAERGGHG